MVKERGVKSDEEEGAMRRKEQRGRGNDQEGAPTENKIMKTKLKTKMR